MRENRNFSLTRERKEARLNSYGTEISISAYNLLIGGSVAYGLILNLILAFTAYPLVANINPLIFIIGYFILVIAGTLISSRSTNPLTSFIGYNMICVPIGLLLSTVLPGYAFGTILVAFGLTAAITVLMTIAAAALPNLFLKMGTALFTSLICVIVVELLALLFKFPVGWIDGIAVLIFSLYIGYDYAVAQRYPKTADNAIDSSIDIYLDIINLFVRILSIISKKD